MDWGAVDGRFEDDTDVKYALPMIRDVHATRLEAMVRQAELNDDFSCIGWMNLNSSAQVLLGNIPGDIASLDLSTLVSLHTESEGSGFDALQNKLVANLNWKKAIGHLHWLRS